MYLALASHKILKKNPPIIVTPRIQLSSFPFSNFVSRKYKSIPRYTTNCPIFAHSKYRKYPWVLCLQLLSICTFQTKTVCFQKKVWSFPPLTLLFLYRFIQKGHLYQNFGILKLSNSENWELWVYTTFIITYNIINYKHFWDIFYIFYQIFEGSSSLPSPVGKVVDVDRRMRCPWRRVTPHPPLSRFPLSRCGSGTARLWHHTVMSFTTAPPLRYP